MKEVIINTMVLIYIRYSKSATKNRCSCISHNNTPFLSAKRKCSQLSEQK